MAAQPIDYSTITRYDECETPGGDKQNIPTVDPAARQPVKQKLRPAPDIEMTLQVEYVSGPESESLARTQYDAIREVLQWLYTNQRQVE